MNRCLEDILELDDQRKDHPDPKRSHTHPSDDYRPITCLLMMWKILTVQVREEIYYSLISYGLFPEEQKGCCKGTRGLLYIDQHILKKSKTWGEKCSYGMDWLQKSILYGPPKLNNRLSQNLQGIQWIHKVYQEYHDKLVSDIRRKKLSW